MWTIYVSLTAPPPASICIFKVTTSCDNNQFSVWQSLTTRVTFVNSIWLFCTRLSVDLNYLSSSACIIKYRHHNPILGYFRKYWIDYCQLYRMSVLFNSNDLTILQKHIGQISFVPRNYILSLSFQKIL